MGAPVFPNVLASLPAGVLLNFTTMDTRIENAYSTQGNIEIEQRLGQKGTLSVAYHCVAAGTTNGCRPNPNYANNSQYRSAADSKYDGLHVSYQLRPVRWGSYRVSYAYSKSFNNVGENFFSSPINPFNIWQDYGRAASCGVQRGAAFVDGQGQHWLAKA